MAFTTIKEVNDMLPQVREKVLFLQELKEYLRGLTERRELFFDSTKATSSQGNAFLQQQESKFHQAVDKASELFYNMNKELQAKGIIIKDLEKGFVDFTFSHKEKELLLCWTVNEEEIAHWHDKEEGYLGRKSIFELENPDL